MIGEPHEFERGQADGRRDGASGVKALAATIQERHYSRSYREGYAHGYAKALEARTGARV